MNGSSSAAAAAAAAATAATAGVPEAILLRQLSLGPGQVSSSANATNGMTAEAKAAAVTVAIVAGNGVETSSGMSAHTT